METLPTEDLLSAANRYLSEHVGLYFSEMRYADLERGINTTSKELSFESAGKLIDALLKGMLNKIQVQLLVRNLTIGETYFFRDPDVFVSLEQRHLHELLKQKKGSRRLRIWSAGCSSGEEPYSIAISLARTLKPLNTYEITLNATDINTDSLDKGRLGVYGNWSFRTTPTEFLPLYFSRIPDGQLKLNDDIKSMVQFGYLNLAEPDYPALDSDTHEMDIVFCRNVLIYFTQKKAKEITDRLSDCLVPGGLLIMSATDSSRFISTPLKNLERISPTTFRKFIETASTGS